MEALVALRVIDKNLRRRKAVAIGRAGEIKTNNGECPNFRECLWVGVRGVPQLVEGVEHLLRAERVYEAERSTVERREAEAVYKACQSAT